MAAETTEPAKKEISAVLGDHGNQLYFVLYSDEKYEYLPREEVKSTKQFQEYVDEKKGRMTRAQARRKLRKFGQAHREEGPERGITSQSRIAYSVEFDHEEKKKKSISKDTKFKTNKSYVPPSQRHQFMAPKDAPPEELATDPLKKKLLEYCRNLLPPEEEESPGNGKKKKRKKKKRKLKHGIEIVNQFMQLKVSPPKSTKDLQKTIEAIEAK